MDRAPTFLFRPRRGFLSLLLLTTGVHEKRFLFDSTFPFLPATMPFENTLIEPLSLVLA